MKTALTARRHWPIEYMIVVQPDHARLQDWPRDRFDIKCPPLSVRLGIRIADKKLPGASDLYPTAYGVKFATANNGSEALDIAKEYADAWQVTTILLRDEYGRDLERWTRESVSDEFTLV